MTHLIGPCECHSCFGSLAQKILFSHICKMLTSMFFVVERDNRHDIGTCSGQFVELPEDIFQCIWKRGSYSPSAPLITSVTRKERIAGTGQILSPLYSVWCVYLPWLCIPLKANTERQCTMALSILLQLLFCSKLKTTLHKLELLRRL